MRTSNASTLLALAVVVASVGGLLGPGLASANGRPPLANELIGHPDDDQRLVLRNTFGLAITTDGGSSWSWACEQAIGYTGVFDPAVTYAPGGALLVSLPVGLVRTTDGCTFDPVPGTDELQLGAAHWGGGTQPVYLAGRDGTAGPLFVSTDGGQSLEVRGQATLVEGEEVSGLVVATVDEGGVAAERVYLSLWNPDSQTSRLVIYDDEGQTSREQALVPTPERPFVRVVAAVSAGDAGPPETPPMLVLAAGDNASSTDLLLHLTLDEGAELEALSKVAGPAYDLLVAEPGHWLLATGQPLVDITDSGTTFSQKGDLNTYCLLPYRGATLACTAHLRVGYAIARSDDDGQSFQPWMNYQSLEAPRCAADSPAALACLPLYPALQEQLRPPPVFDGGPPDLDRGDLAAGDGGDDVVAGPDAARTDAVDNDTGNGQDTGGGGGCAVAAPGPGQGRASWLLLGLLLVAAAIRRTARS